MICCAMYAHNTSHDGTSICKHNQSHTLRTHTCWLVGVILPFRLSLSTEYTEIVGLVGLICDLYDSFRMLVTNEREFRLG